VTLGFSGSREQRSSSRDSTESLVMERTADQSSYVPNRGNDGSASVDGEDEIPACQSCRKRKLKCSREMPSCTQCSRLGQPDQFLRRAMHNSHHSDVVTSDRLRMCLRPKETEAGLEEWCRGELESTPWLVSPCIT